MYLFNTFLQILKNCPVVRLRICKGFSVYILTTGQFFGISHARSQA